jgi:hypothetical protein
MLPRKRAHQGSLHQVLVTAVIFCQRPGIAAQSWKLRRKQPTDMPTASASGFARIARDLETIFAYFVIEVPSAALALMQIKKAIGGPNCPALEDRSVTRRRAVGTEVD